MEHRRKVKTPHIITKFCIIIGSVTQIPNHVVTLVIVIKHGRDIINIVSPSALDASRWDGHRYQEKAKNQIMCDANSTQEQGTYQQLVV